MDKWFLRCIRHYSFLGMVIGSALPATPGHAQCNGNLGNELLGLLAISDSILQSVRHNGALIPRDSALLVIRSPELFGAKASRASYSTGCLNERRETFSQIAGSALPAGEHVTLDTLRYAIAHAGSALLGERYHANDRIGLVFGIGFNVVTNKQDTETFKIVSRRDSGSAADTRYVVEESDSRTFPSAVSGLLIRVWDRTDRPFALFPTAVFGSVQFSSVGSTGPVNGVSLGVGWELIGSTHILLGYSVYRVRALREDLRTEWGRRTDGRLPLPPGETEESILGVEGANAFTLSLAVPVSLRAAFGAP